MEAVVHINVDIEPHITENYIVGKMIPKQSDIKDLGIVVTILPPLFNNIPEMWLHMIGLKSNPRLAIYAGLKYTEENLNSLVKYLTEQLEYYDETVFKHNKTLTELDLKE